MGYSLHTKTNPSLKHAATCHSLPPPPWPQLFDQPPIPNRLPRSQFLSDLDRSSGKIYLPPLTNASITCESPSSRRRPLEIDHRTKSTSIWSGGDRKGGIKVLFVVRSISRESRRDDGDSKVPSGRYILQLTKSKSDKN